MLDDWLLKVVKGGDIMVLLIEEVYNCFYLEEEFKKISINCFCMIVGNLVEVK